MGELGTQPVVEAPVNLAVALPTQAGTLTQEQAKAIYEQGPEAVVFALMKLAHDRAELAKKVFR